MAIRIGHGLEPCGSDAYQAHVIKMCTAAYPLRCWQGYVTTIDLGLALKLHPSAAEAQGLSSLLVTTDGIVLQGLLERNAARLL